MPYWYCHASMPCMATQQIQTVLYAFPHSPHAEGSYISRWASFSLKLRDCTYAMPLRSLVLNLQNRGNPPHLYRHLELSRHSLGSYSNKLVKPVTWFPSHHGSPFCFWVQLYFWRELFLRIIHVGLVYSYSNARTLLWQISTIPFPP